MPVAAPAASRLESLVETRERILAAARDVVAEEGWQGAQIALIAARAGVATGSGYRYFESKSTMFAQVLADVSEHEIAILRSIFDGKGTARQRVHDGVQAFVRRAMKSRRLAYALIAEPCEPGIDATRIKYRAAIENEFVRVLRQGVAGGEFVDQDPRVIASCLTGAFTEAVAGPLAPAARTDARAAERYAATIAGLCTRMVCVETGGKARR
jgi:AcrR family transcriptional regulator